MIFRSLFLPDSAGTLLLVSWPLCLGCALSNILHQNTSLAFDSNDIDDKAVIALGEMVPRMLAEREKYNAEHPTEPIPTVSVCTLLSTLS